RTCRRRRRPRPWCLVAVAALRHGERPDARSPGRRGQSATGWPCDGWCRLPALPRQASVDETLVAVDEAGSTQLGERVIDLADGLSVDLANLERAALAAVDQHAQRSRPALDAEGQHAVSAALEVRGQCSID